jgi:hypothetical protein
MARMAREHMPIQIGLPDEPAWEFDEPVPVAYIAFVEGEELPDPGAAFIAAGESFGVAPQDTEPVPVEDERVAWAFAFGLPSRASRVIVWCERAIEGASPDGRAQDARWVVCVQSLLDPDAPVDDAVRLVATAARAGGSRTRLAFDPTLGVAWSREELDELFLSDAAGSLVDERHLYRVELVARDRERGPYWITTVGLSRAARPELELLEVPVESVRAALELIDALASRFIADPLPHAGVPVEAGPGVRVAFVPAQEAIETLASDAPGGSADRAGLPAGPRAAICAAGMRGSFRKVWVPPLEELARMARAEAGLYLAPRVSLVRERVAQRTWDAFVRTHARHASRAEVVFEAKIALGESEGEREHVWIAVEQAHEGGGRGMLARPGEAAGPRAFERAMVGDWRITGLGAEMPEVGPESARLLD